MVTKAKKVLTRLKVLAIAKKPLEIQKNQNPLLKAESFCNILKTENILCNIASLLKNQTFPKRVKIKYYQKMKFLSYNFATVIL